MLKTEALQALRRQTAYYFLPGLAALLGGFYFSLETWSASNAARWLVLALSAYLYFGVVLWRGLAENHRPDETSLLPTIGAANALTLLRAVLMSAVFGFLFSPRPEGTAAWLPGVLYTLASLPDYVDGIVARKTNHVTGLGELLDMNVDSVGVFTATFLSVQYGVIPWWYLPIGLARYLFVIGIWLRKRAGKAVHDLPFSHRRRGFAALKMGFMFVMLFPLFGPPGTYLAAAAFGVPFAVAFLWDWWLVSGVVPPDWAARYRAQAANFLAYGLLVLRFLAVVLIFPFLKTHLAVPALRPLGFAEVAVTALLALGVLPRVTAILAVCLLGVNQNIAPLAAPQNLLVIVYIETIFLGSGRFSLLPLEDRLIFHRIGDPG